MGVVLINEGCSKPVKTVAYFNAHYEELQSEAKRCVEDARKNINIEKDQTCMNLVQAETEMCKKKMNMMGNMFGIDCEDKATMMSVAYHGL